MNSPDDLTALELRFQRLRFQLSLKISPRLKTRLLGSFCDSLLQRTNQVLNLSYYEELRSQLVELCTKSNLCYQAPLVHAAFHETLLFLSKTGSQTGQQPDLKAALKTAWSERLACCLSLGEYGQVIELGRLAYPCSLDNSKIAGIHDLDALVGMLKSQDAAPEIIAEIRSYQKAAIASFSGWNNRSVWVPLVENFDDGEGTKIIVGTLNPLELDLEPRQSQRQQDVISFNNHPISNDDLVNYQAQDAIRAARQQHPLLRNPRAQFYTVRFGFPGTEHLHTGTSFGLGMALLSMCSLEKEANLRKQHRLGQHIAFTGGVDFSGSIRSVDQTALEEKIKAAFFSPLVMLAIPFENFDEANKTLEKLKQQFPHKQFQLKRVSLLAEALQDGELLTYKKMPFRKWLKTHLTRSKLLQGSIGLLILTLLLWFMVDLLTDKNPSSYRIEGESVTILNRSGRYLWKLDLGHSPKVLEKPLSPNPIYNRLQIHDFDGDGENEVILGTAVKQREFNGKLMFLETDGTVKWEYSSHPVLTFGENEYSDNYGTAFILPFQHKDDVWHEFYVSFSHMPWFPNRLVRFDINGQVLNEFIHPGAIYDLELIDLNQDGEQEILLGCTNNGFNSAAVAILPSRNFSGTVPSLEAQHGLNNGVVDSNLTYIKFPRWGKYDYAGSNARTNVQDIFPDSKHGFIAIVVLGNGNSGETFFYNFDFDLNVVGLSPADGFLSHYHEYSGEDFFETFDYDEWYSNMSKLEIYRNGSWSK